MPKSIRRAVVFSCLTSVAACTPSGGDTTPSEKPANDSGADGGDAGREVEPAPSTKITVASVQMIQDCPDTEVEAAPADEPVPGAAMPAQGAPSQPKRPPSEVAGDVAPGDSFRQPCDQSTVQLAIESNGEAPVAIEIAAVRLLSEGKRVGTLETRKPKMWQNNRYEAWDQQVAPGAPIKASYKLSMPNWSEVEAAIGESSFGHMFTLEIDVRVDGEIQTVSSPQFPREEPHVIVT